MSRGNGHPAELSWLARARRRLAVLVPLGLLTAAVTVLQVDPAGAAFLGRDGAIAFSAVAETRDGLNFDIFSMRPDGSGKRNLTSSPMHEEAPSWSPDGRQVAFVKGQNLYVMNRSGKRERLIVGDDLAPQTTPYLPSWSPDGTHILFLLYQPTDSGSSSSSIETIRLADGEQRTLVPAREGAMHFDPGWSPDGSHVVFSRYVWGPGVPLAPIERAADADLMIVDTATREERLLAGGPAWEHRGSWTPGGDVVFVSSDICDARRCSDIVRISPDGLQRENLTNDPGDWSGQGTADYFNRVEVSPSGDRLLLGIIQADSPTQLWLWDPRSDKKTKLLDEVNYFFDWQPRCSVLGTPGDDILLGTPGRDLICGLGGDDVVRAGGGKDAIFGHAGNDRISGGRGADIVVGNAGRDRCDRDQRDYSRVC